MKKEMVQHFSLSTNIQRDKKAKLNYINTPNSSQVFKHIKDSYKEGVHSFTIIGSYGTGKSSFLWALDQHFSGNKIFESGFAENVKRGCNSITVIGEYASFIGHMANELKIDANVKDKCAAILSALGKLILAAKRQARLFSISIDEFGKFLEYAAKFNPEKELYFIQQLSEFINDFNKAAILITSLHQDFSGYAAGLSKPQRNEWEKVKGRFKEITFNEPVEQLLLLVSDKMKIKKSSYNDNNLDKLFRVISDASIYPLRDYLTISFSRTILPFDILTAATLTLALQRYGQNERSVFSFINSSDPYSLKDFDNKKNPFYNLANLYDYLQHNYYSFLNVKYNPHYTQWAAMKSAIEKAEAKFELKGEAHVQIIKIIGLLNIFANPSGKIDQKFIINYCRYAMNIANASDALCDLENNKIIRFKKISQRFILLDGTDVDIELAIDEAGKLVESVSDVAHYLKQHFDFPYVSARGISIQKGTPRFFQFFISSQPEPLSPAEETDGYINLIFSDKLRKEDVLKFSSENQGAVLYGLFNNTTEIRNLLYEINKTEKAIELHISDKVAIREFRAIFQHYVSQLNHAVWDSIYSKSGIVSWFFDGKTIVIDSRKAFNSFLSSICAFTYPLTPVYKNELINRTKYSSQILVARRILIKKLLKHVSEPDLGFKNTEFPPEKTIYLTLIKATGIHVEKEGNLVLTTPQDKNLGILWSEGNNFLEKSKSGRISVQELVEIYNRPPYKLKKGFIDFWLSVFLIANRDEFALFSDALFIPDLTEDSLELLLRNPKAFAIKSFNLSGVRLELFNRYREMMSQKPKQVPKAVNFIETVRPFLMFYSKEINTYARTTKRIPLKAQKFRQAIASATDPEKAFFEDFPSAFGYTADELQSNLDLLNIYLDEIKESIKSIRLSYENLINRFESHISEKVVGEVLGFYELKKAIQDRFSQVKIHLLSNSQRIFLDRIFSAISERDSYLNSLAQACVGKPLESFSDNDEPVLIDKFDLFIKELDNITQLSGEKFDAKKEDLLKLEITHFFEDVQQHIIRLPKSKTKEIDEKANRIANLLSKDKQVNISILTRLLMDQMK